METRVLIAYALIALLIVWAIGLWFYATRKSRARSRARHLHERNARAREADPRLAREAAE